MIATVMHRPRAWLGSGAWVHRDIGRVETAQRGIEPAHRADIRRAVQPQVTVVTVRPHRRSIEHAFDVGNRV
jgi:hypothetical protein